jgi:intein/homing endonuclease
MAEKRDNFAVWRERARKAGIIKSHYPEFCKNGDLAELIGVVLGDGHIEKFPRTERLLIFSNANNRGFVERYSSIVRTLFQKEPSVSKMKNANCVRIGVYEKHISRRLGIPSGSRKNIRIVVPTWILRDGELIKRYLRGLYEAEGSVSHHYATSTHKFSFANLNQSMLKNVVKLLKILGFSPHADFRRVQISRKREVERAIEMLQFRKY